MDKVRVLHIQRGLPFHEGSSTYVLTLLRSLPRDRFDASLAVLTNPQWGVSPLLTDAEAAGIRVLTLESKDKLSMQNLTQVLTILRRERIDLVHIHGYKSLATALPAAKFSRLPIVASTHGWTKASARAIAYEGLERGLLRHCHMITVGSEALRRDLVARGFDESRVRVVYNAVDAGAIALPADARARARAAVRRELKLPEDCTLVGAVGRLSREKGHRHLIAAMSEFIPLRPEAKVLIVGEGQEKQNLERLAWKQGVGESLILRETWGDMAELYAALDLFVLPSLAESLPMVVLEAAAAGTPIVATQVGGVGEVIEDGRSGLLVGPGDPKELARSVLWAIEHPAEVRGYAEAAQRKVREQFGAEAMAEAMGGVYGDALARKAEGGTRSAEAR